MSYFYGGTFTSMSEADTLRSAAYKYYGISIPRHALTRPRVLVILREAIHGNLPGRAIENIDEVEAILTLSWAQTSYNAAIQVGANVIPQSLMDYLK